MGNRITDASYPYKHIYKDTVGGTYTQYSHSLLSAQIKYALPNYQIAQANIGTDAEKVRNAVQNRLIHDMILLPKNWHKQVNAHVPMLDDKGGQYLYKEGQKIKPAALYYNLNLNPATFY